MMLTALNGLCIFSHTLFSELILVKTTKSCSVADFLAYTHKLNKLIPSVGLGRSMAHFMTAINTALLIFWLFPENVQSFRDRRRLSSANLPN